MPIYTEYALASHVMFGAGFAGPGLVDWVMAQRRGSPAQAAPWIAITTPANRDVWPTSYTNVTFAGEASSEFAITSVAWRNQNLGRSGAATGTTQWTAADIPLRAGVVAAAGVTPATNLVTITATAASGSGLYGGATVSFVLSAVACFCYALGP